MNHWVKMMWAWVESMFPGPGTLGTYWVSNKIFRISPWTSKAFKYRRTH